MFLHGVISIFSELQCTLAKKTEGRFKVMKVTQNGKYEVVYLTHSKAEAPVKILYGCLAGFIACLFSVLETLYVLHILKARVRKGKRMSV